MVELLIFYLCLALGVSFLCSLVEAAILSLTRAQVAALEKKGRPSGRILRSMKENVDRPLAAILTLNTVAHTFGAAGIGAESLALFGHEWVAVVSIILTVAILVVSEIIPKTLGAAHAGSLAPFTAYCVKGMILFTYPLVVVFQALSRVLSGKSGPSVLTREDLALLAELGQQEGALDEKEYRVLRNLLRLNKIRVSEVMTPRNVALMLPKEMTVADAVEKHGPLRFSRTPIYDGGPDHPVGIALRPRIYEALREGGGGRTLGEIAQPIHAVPEVATVGDVLNEFVKRREQLFLVVDEYGGTAGLVTLEDAIETLLGEEIVDETDFVVDMRQLGAKLLHTRLRGRKP